MAKLLGYLEDYACLTDGLLALHESDLDARWLSEAVSLADAMIDLFWDDAVGGCYDTGRDHEQLVVRPRDVFDNAQPCGGSVAADVLLRLGVITGNDDYSSKGATPLRAMQQLLGRAPAATGHWLGALDFYVSLPKEIVIVGSPQADATGALLDQVATRFLPNRVVVGLADPAQPPIKDSPLLEQRTMQEGRPTAYLCEHYVCQLPVTQPDQFAALLDR